VNVQDAAHYGHLEGNKPSLLMEYEMLNSEKEKDIAICCYSMVCSMFATMSNPYNQGPNFSWDTFAESMSIFSRDNILERLPVKPSDKEESKLLAQSLARRIAESMVKQMKE
jgi:hypothetical protein